MFCKIVAGNHFILSALGYRGRAWRVQADFNGACDTGVLVFKQIIFCFSLYCIEIDA